MLLYLGLTAELYERSLLIHVRDSPGQRQLARAFDMQRRPGDGFLIIRNHKYPFCNHAMWNERWHVQIQLMNTYSSAFSGGELPSKAHPFRPKPIVDAND